METEPDPNRKVAFFTRRPLYKEDDPNKKSFGESPYYCVIWAYEDEPGVMHVNYSCLKCESKDCTTSDYDPFAPVKFKCKSCNTEFEIPRLRGKRGKRKPKA